MLVLISVLMLVQDGLFKAATGFGITSIEPCEDTARGGGVFYLLQWVPDDSAVNATTCVAGAEILRRNRDTSLVTLPVPSNSSLFAQPALDLLEEYSDTTGLRFVWGVATLVGPLLWVLAELVAVLLPRLFDSWQEEGRVRVSTYLLVAFLCFLMSMVCNFMLIINASVQWHETERIFAAAMGDVEMSVHLGAAVSLTACFVLTLVLVGASALGTCCFRQCPRLCRCFLGASDKEDAVQGLICRLTLMSVLITLVGVLLKSVSVAALADEYGAVGHGLIDEYQALLANVTWSTFSPTNFLDRPSLSTDLIGDYFLYLRRDRPSDWSLLRAYVGLRDTVSWLLLVKVMLSCLAIGTACGSVCFRCGLSGCQAVHSRSGAKQLRVGTRV